MYEKLVEGLRSVIDAVYHSTPPKEYKLPCVTYYLGYEGRKASADNREYLTTYSFYVNVYAKTVREMNNLTAEVKRALEERGFRRKYLFDDTEDGVKRKIMRFEIIGGN